MKLLKPGTNLRAALSLTVKSKQLSMLVLDITPTIVSGPADSNDSYTIDPAMTVKPVDQFLATVTGTVVKGARDEKVSAEIAGTDQIVATVNTQKNGTFTLGLPAVAALPGTAYDIFASGTLTSFFPLAHEAFTPGTRSLGDLTPHRPQAGAGLSGTIVDKCTGVGIQGVTLNVLTPATNDAGADCTKTPPTGCVVVARGATFTGGSYSVVNPATSFNPIPTGKGTKYTFRISASGYDSLITPIDSTTTNLKCPGSGDPDKKCNFSLTRGVINGTVTLAAMNTGAPLSVMVMAEPSSTNTIANVVTTTIPTGASAAPFAIMVPTTKTVATLDLFASAKDLFGGKPEQATGHTIAVLQGVTAPDPTTACATPVNLSSDLGPMDCLGHGSVSGMASTFDQNTTIVLSKLGVQLMQSQVGPGGVFNFCAPPDPAKYTLQRFESETLISSVPMVMLNSPSLIATPCSSICTPSAPGKCFLCANTPGITVP